MKKLLLFLLLALPVINVFCQTTAAIDPIENKNIHKLLELTGSAKLAEQVVNQMIGSFRQAMPDVPDEYWTKFQKEIDYNELIDLIVPVYAKHFSNDEILQLIDFYQSPIGQKYVSELPALMQESMEAGRQWGEQIGEKVINDMEKKKK